MAAELVDQRARRAPRSHRARRGCGCREWNAPSRAACAASARREGDHRPAQPLLEAARHQSDDALVPARHRTDTRRARRTPLARIAQRAHGRARFGLHARLDAAPLAVEPIELAAPALRASAGSSRSRQRMPIDMSVRRPAALSRGATAKPRSAATRLRALAPRHLQQRADAGHAAARRGCAPGPAPPGCDCWRRTAPRPPRCRAPPDPAAPPRRSAPAGSSPPPRAAGAAPP